ncbi:MAG TPA: PD-(D/E)XK nuclease family protein [Persephonella sp.]|nr:PD-(D/E)XK nuclease family protein [Persephonella sp.]
MNRYYSGSYSYLKERLLEIVREIQKNPAERITFIVHTNQMKRYLKEFITEKLGILINAEFFTVIDFSKKLTGKEPITDFEKQIILKRILQKKGYNLDGFAWDLGILLQQLKEFDIPIEKISSKFVKEIISDYESFKGRSFYDREDLHRLAVEEQTDFKTDHLIIFGIHAVPELYKKLFTKASKLSKSLYVFTHFHRNSGYYINHSHFKKVREFYEQISDFVSFETEKHPNIQTAKSVYRFDRSFRINSPYIQIHNLPDERSEIKFTAQKIVHLKKSGVSYSRIGVIVPEAEVYLPYIKEIFTRYHIPYYLTEENRYIDDYSCRKIMDLLTLKVKGISKETILGILSDGVFSIEDPDEIHKNIIQSPPFFDFSEFERFVLNRKKFDNLKDLILSILNLPDEQDIRFYINAFRNISSRFLKDTEGKQFFENLLDRIENKKLFVHLFDRISYTDLIDIFKLFFEEEASDKRDRIDGVTVVSPTQAEGNNFEHVFFLNLNAGRYPNPLKDELILSREEFGKINYPYHVLMQELLNFCSIFDRGKFIYLSYISKEINSRKEAVPSIFLQEIIRITGKKPEKTYPQPVMPDEIKAEYPLIDPKISNHKKRIDRYRKPSLTIFSIKIDITFPLSATSFQKYPRCPYRFFLEEVNGFKEEAVTERKEISPIDEGIVIHEFLEKFYKNLDLQSIKDPEDFVDKRKPALKKKFFSRINPLINSLIPSYRPIELKRTEAVFERLVSFLKEDIKFLKKNKSKVVLIEKSISDGIFTGRIDRADKDPEGNITIYDYKTGKNPPTNIKKEIKTKYSQLLVYKKILGKKIKKLGILAVNDKEKKFRYTVDAEETDFVEQMLGLIKEGVFPPVKNSLCDYCSFSDFCPRDEEINKKIKEKYKVFEELL